MLRHLAKYTSINHLYCISLNPSVRTCQGCAEADVPARSGGHTSHVRAGCRNLSDTIRALFTTSSQLACALRLRSVPSTACVHFVQKLLSSFASHVSPATATQSAKLGQACSYVIPHCG